MEKIILASGSPRRKELLAQIGVPFIVDKSNCDEVVSAKAPEDIVRELAMQKARDTASRHQDGIILGADTIVWAEGEKLGKPAGYEEARCMLRKLSGRAHSVYTGVALIRKSSGVIVEEKFLFRETRVHVHEMSDEEIEAYLETGDSYDKAGAYGIQGPFAAFVDEIEGDYLNVVGLPASAVYQALKEWR